MQLHEKSGEIQILSSVDNFQYVTLDELLPDWWGRELFDEKSV